MRQVRKYSASDLWREIGRVPGSQIVSCMDRMWRLDVAARSLLALHCEMPIVFRGQFAGEWRSIKVAICKRVTSQKIFSYRLLKISNAIQSIIFPSSMKRSPARTQRY
eukprot:scaffold4680_cov164-Skeletonema_marinoi.AAC.11